MSTYPTYIYLPTHSTPGTLYTYIYLHLPTLPYPTSTLHLPTLPYLKYI